MAAKTPPKASDRRSDPLVLRALIVAALAALAAFGVKLTAAQYDAILTLAMLGLPPLAALATAWWARRHVWSEESVHTLLAARGEPQPRGAQHGT